MLQIMEFEEIKMHSYARDMTLNRKCVKEYVERHC